MGEITYICKRTVVSTKPVEAGKYMGLSVIDRQMEKNHIKMVYYYYYPTSEEGEITKKLKQSLSETLTFFPIMTGRLIKDDDNKMHWKVKCNDAGVRMKEAKAKGSVNDWLTNVNKEKELQLVFWEDMYQESYFWSTFYVQITEFEEGGLAIGLSCTHLLADLTCVTMFMNAWANTSLLHKMISPPIFHTLPSPSLRNKDTSHHTYTTLINHYNNSHLSKPINIPLITKPKYTTITLGFSDEMVRACIAMAQTPNGPSPSPFEALAGLFWVCLSKIKGKKDNLLDLSICLDMRKTLGLNNEFFGNCMIYNKVNLDTEDKNKSLLPQAVRAIREVVSKMDSEGIMDLIEWLEDNDDVNCPTLMNGCDLICASLEGVDPYLAMFEHGIKLMHVSYYIEPMVGEEGQVLIFLGPSHEGPLGRVAMVTLEENEAIKLCDDDLIAYFSPTTNCMKSR